MSDSEAVSKDRIESLRQELSNIESNKRYRIGMRITDYMEQWSVCDGKKEPMLIPQDVAFLAGEAKAYGEVAKNYLWDLLNR